MRGGESWTASFTGLSWIHLFLFCFVADAECIWKALKQQMLLHLYKFSLTWSRKKLLKWFFFSPFILSRNGNGLKPAPLTAITSPPAASVPLTVWLVWLRPRDGHMTLVFPGSYSRTLTRLPLPLCVCCVLMWPLGGVLSTHVMCSVHQVSRRRRSSYATADLIKACCLNTRLELLLLCNIFTSHSWKLASWVWHSCTD